MERDQIATGKLARALIRRKVRKLIGRGVFHSEDSCDVEQELVLRLLAGLRLFDPARGPIEAFVALIIDRAAGMLLRERITGKRNGTTVPLDAGEPAHETDVDQIDLELDLADVMAALPEELRVVAALLLESRDISKAARRRGLARSSFLRHVERLRRHLENSGLRIYLESPGSMRHSEGQPQTSLNSSTKPPPEEPP